MLISLIIVDCNIGNKMDTAQLICDNEKIMWDAFVIRDYVNFTYASYSVIFILSLPLLCYCCVITGCSMRKISGKKFMLTTSSQLQIVQRSGRKYKKSKINIPYVCMWNFLSLFFYYSDNHYALYVQFYVKISRYHLFSP